MFVFGHLGIGNKVASPWSRDLPKFPLFLGMLLPDIVDKPLYYAHIWPYISCTRTFGHSGAFLLLILLASFVARAPLVSRAGLRTGSRRDTTYVSRWLAALALGVSTHLLLDCLLDRIAAPAEPSAALTALTWPLLHSRFSDFPFRNWQEHARHLLTAPILISEAVGASLLGWDYWKSRHRGAIRQVVFSRRWRALRRKRMERG